MDDRTGEIFTPSELMQKLKKVDPRKLFEEVYHYHPMNIQPTEQQAARVPPRVGRNEPCPCGSGKKFKKCHLFTQEDGK